MRVRKVPTVQTLRDTEATRETITRSAAIAAAVKPGGTLWFVFVGHGAPSARGDDGLLLGVDVQPNSDSAR